MGHRTVIFTMLCLILSLSGCVEQKPVSEVAVTIGAWAVYETRTNATLHVQIVGEDSVRDAWGNLHPVVRIDHELQSSGTGDHTVHITEYVHVDTGRHVRHDVKCYLDQYDEDVGCDDRYVQSFFAAHGFPGALGLGPSWALGMAPMDLQDSDPRGFQANPPPKSAWEAVEDVPGCWRRVPSEDVWEPFGAWLPVTAIARPLVWCQDAPFPREFYADMAFPRGFPEEDVAHFHLARWGKESSMDWPSSNAPWDVVQPPDPRPLDPLGIVADEDGFLSFTSKEAHQVLLERSTSYRNAIEDGAHIVASHYNEARSTFEVRDDTVSSTHEWRMFLGLVDGSTHRYPIQKEIRTVAGQEMVAFQPLPDSRSEVEMSVPTPSPSLRLDDAIARTSTLFGCDNLLGAGWTPRIDHGARSGLWTDVRTDRVMAHVSHKPPFVTSNIWTPWAIMFDGLTGKPVEAIFSPDELQAFDERGFEPLSGC